MFGYHDQAAETAHYEESARYDDNYERYAAEAESLRHEDEAAEAYQHGLWLEDLAARGLTEAEGEAELAAQAEAELAAQAEAELGAWATLDDDDDIPF